MRLGWFRPVQGKSLPVQEVRALLTARKLLQTKNHDVEMSLRGVLRGFGEGRPDDTANLRPRPSSNWLSAMPCYRRLPRRCSRGLAAPPDRRAFRCYY
jgi:hypothetical protein